MSDTGETVFIIQCYLVFIAAYLIPLVAFIVLSENHSQAFIILFYLPFTFLYHIWLIKRLKIKDDSIQNTFWGKDDWQKQQQWIFGCPLAFCHLSKFTQLADLGEKLMRKYEGFIFISKLVSVGSLVYWFFVEENSDELVMVILLISIHGIIAFYDIEIVQIVIFTTVFLIPLILALIIMPCVQDACSCLFKQHNENNREAEVELGEAQIVILNQNAQVDNNEGNDDNIRFAAVQRTTTNKAMDNIMHNWRRKFSMKDKNVESCCVWLEDFKKEDQIIELKCGVGHIFHPEWLQSWAQRHHSCPLCRADFVDIAKMEGEKPPEPENPAQMSIGEEGVLPVERSDSLQNRQAVNPEVGLNQIIVVQHDEAEEV